MSTIPGDSATSFLMETAQAAGDEILAVYGREFTTQSKGDGSPLTEADRASNDCILAALHDRYPEIPVISEETRAVPYTERRDWETFWLVDPLDGTKEFINRNGEFTVNIALVHQGVPTVGVVYQPVGETLFFGLPGHGGFKQVGRDGGRVTLAGGDHYAGLDHVRVVASRSHASPEVTTFVEELEKQGKSVAFTAAGSSLKICLVAEGAADVYPRFGPTMEWDTAAGHAVAASAGRQVLAHDSRKSLTYNKEDLLNPWFVVE